MRIAGHVDDPQHSPNKPNCIIEISLDDVLYVHVDENNQVQVHLLEQVYYEIMHLHEYMLLEERLENSDFIRVNVGTYVNLRRVYSYDEKNNRIFFDQRKAGKFVEIAWLRAKLLKMLIENAVARNNENSIEYKIETNQSRSLFIRSTED
nr:LytTR family DNA-binding domain-containing protein [Paenibacillus artemisiicola]